MIKPSCRTLPSPTLHWHHVSTFLISPSETRLLPIAYQNPVLIVRRTYDPCMSIDRMVRVNKTVKIKMLILGFECPDTVRILHATSVLALINSQSPAHGKYNPPYHFVVTGASQSGEKIPCPYK